MIDEEENFRWKYIKAEYLIKFTDGNYVDWYIINEPSGTRNNAISSTVTCSHISTLLKTKNIYLTFDDENGIGPFDELAEKILEGTGWALGKCPTFYEADGRTERIRSLKSTSNEGAYNLMAKLCTLFNAYPMYNGDLVEVTVGGVKMQKRLVDIYSLNDLNTEWELVVGKNLNSLQYTYDSSSVVTRLFVEGEYGDFGYVGIDDVNPTGLNYLMNFDYYKGLGLFTAEHQKILDQYLIDAKNKKTQISSAQTSLNALIDQVTMAVGYTPFTVYIMQQSGSYSKILTSCPVFGATKSPSPGDDLIAIKSSSSYDHIEQPNSSNYPRGYSYIIYFERACLGQIGVNESSIEAKEQQIASWQRKLDMATEYTPQERIDDYELQIQILQNDILNIYRGTGGTPSLYKQMYDVAIQAVQMYSAMNNVTTRQGEFDVIEAKFLAAMGDMLRDGRWTDDNYTIGQEQSLYADAQDMMARLSKPSVTYHLTYKSAKEILGFGAEDIDVNTVGHIWDEKLNVNDYGYIESITIVHDDETSSKIEVTTDDGFSKQVSLESVMTRIAKMAELVNAKNALYERAGALSSNGQLASERLEGVIDVMVNKLQSTISNWYTDEQGNIMFESVNGTGAMMLCGEGFMIASQKDANGDWMWRT